VFSQNYRADSIKLENIDSVANELIPTNPDSALNILWQGLVYLKRVNYPDSLESLHEGNLYFTFGRAFMYKEDNNLSLEYYYKALSKYLLYRYYTNAASCYHQIGYMYMDNGLYEVALENFKTAYSINTLKGLDDVASRNILNMGNCYVNLGKYQEALSVYIETLKLKEKIGDKTGVANCQLNLGSINKILGNNAEANKYFFLALDFFKKEGNKLAEAQAYNNIGLVYITEQNHEKAEEYFNKAIVLYNELNQTKRVGRTYCNLGTNAQKQGNHLKAKEYFLKYKEIAEKSKNLDDLAAAFHNLAVTEKYIGQYNNALKYFSQAITLMDTLHINHQRDQLYIAISETYEEMGNYKKSVEWYKKFIAIKDSLFGEEKVKQMEEMEKKYQGERKQKEIEIQQEQLKRKQVEIDIQNQISERQVIQRNAFIIGFILSILIVLLVYRSYIQKKKTNVILFQQKEEIQSQRDRLSELNGELVQRNEEIVAQRDEIESQRDLLFAQKSKIEKIHHELTDSIRYAQRIQSAILPSEIQLKENLAEFFLLFQPRDIVSGDFYWVTKRKKWLIFCVADCTGHGVPGAFMSMLGITFLNEIIKDEEITSTSTAINVLRDKVVTSLKQQSYLNLDATLSNVKDGMDISLCALNVETKEFQFTGANNPCWIIKNNGEFVELEPDKMPVAIHTVMTPYNEKQMQLELGDRIYLMSDGYQDQFGGIHGKKFMRKNLREMLISNHRLPMQEQKLLIQHTMKDWMGANTQTDDITILGIRV
jgi:serine phosphatase RsbU (regulator of sigma subunit)